MSQDNASFTFLHRIEEVELNIEDGRWQSALALALTLLDIEIFLCMYCFIISSDRSAHSSAKLFNINTDVREAVGRTYSIQLAN